MAAQVPCRKVFLAQIVRKPCFEEQEELARDRSRKSLLGRGNSMNTTTAVNLVPS